MDRRALAERYAAALRDALGEAAADALAEDAAQARNELPDWMRPRLPVAIAESMQVAEAVAGELPEALANHYLKRAPRDWVKQRATRLGAALRLLWRPIEAARFPGFCAAIDGACGLLREQEIDPRRVLGASGAAELLAENPCALQLISEACLASGLPLLGAGEAERAQLVRSLKAEDLETRTPAEIDAIEMKLLDRHLGQHLAHELLHGMAPRESGPREPLQTDSTDPYHLAGPPWIVREAAALWLQSRAHPRHVFPEISGEAIPGVSLFVLIGEGLAAALGAGKLLSVLSEPDRFRERFGARAAALSSIAEWQVWLVRKSAPFAQDALRAVSWIKLVAGAAQLSRLDSQAPGSPDPLPPALAKLQELSDRAASLDLVRAVRELPSLLDAADAIPWRALDDWNREPSIEDELRARVAVRALFQENAMAPIFVTRPAALAQRAEEPIFLETDSCLLHTSPRSQGVFAEPAHWIFPPPLCHRLQSRGLARLELRFAKRADSDALASSLVAMARASGPLPEHLQLTAREFLEDREGRWTSSPR